MKYIKTPFYEELEIEPSEIQFMLQCLPISLSQMFESWLKKVIGEK